MPVPHKIFEKVLYMKTYPQVHKLIAAQQHGFVRGRTIETNLLEFTHYLTKTLDKYHQTQMDVVYTDFQKAFDKVNHQILLRKLHRMGFSSSAVKLFKDYLQQYRQYVNYRGTKSHVYKCITGVPQGGNLASLLFLIYVNDIPGYLKHTRLLLFADDLKIFKEIDTIRGTEDLKTNIRALEQWSEENRLPLNAKKCKIITFTRMRNPINVEYEIHEEKLERVNKIRDLGVLMEKKLNYANHVHSVITKAKRTAGLIRRHSRAFRKMDTLRLLFITLARTHLEFASIIWNSKSKSKTEIDAIELVQKKFLKFLYYEDFLYYDHNITYSELTAG